MKLTEPERLLIAHIINLKLDNSTLKEHILLERIYKKVNPDEIKLPSILDLVENETQRELIEKYDGVKIGDIEDKEHRLIIQDLMKRLKESELKFWSNQEKDNILNVDLTKEEVNLINNIIEVDKRPFPREFHKVIIDLVNKLSGVGG